MSYSKAFVSSLLKDHSQVQTELEVALVSFVRLGHSTQDESIKPYLLHGASRRLEVLRECLRTVFSKFPPSRKKPLPRRKLFEVQINLHAFVINLSGFFDNLAWAFVLRHHLLGTAGGRARVGMFLPATQKLLPPALSAYVTSPTMSAWHRDYLKNYRDSLAHRIPLYIPPARFTELDLKLFSELEREELSSIVAHQWPQVEQARARKLALGSACPMFLQSAGSAAESAPIWLHPQMHL